MSEDEPVVMRCPNCRVKVRGLPEQFAQPIVCPKCQNTLKFRDVVAEAPQAAPKSPAPAPVSPQASAFTRPPAPVVQTGRSPVKTILTVAAVLVVLGLLAFGLKFAAGALAGGGKGTAKRLYVFEPFGKDKDKVPGGTTISFVLTGDEDVTPWLSDFEMTVSSLPVPRKGRVAVQLHGVHGGDAVVNVALNGRDVWTYQEGVTDLAQSPVLELTRDEMRDGEFSVTVSVPSGGEFSTPGIESFSLWEAR